MSDRLHPVPAPVLVVEDDAAIRNALEVYLAARGVRTLFAKNGAEALSVLGTKERPAVILLDLTMPVMDGNAFRKVLLGDPQLARIPVIIVTAQESRPDCLAPLRPDAVLIKPFDPTELDALLARYVSRLRPDDH